MESNELTQTLLTEKQTGTYGVVYRGTLNGMHDVAIKVVEDEEELSSQETEDIDPEVQFLQRVRHKNVVWFFGFGSLPSPFLVFEYMDEGDLSKWLWGQKQESRAWVTRLRLLRDAAAGMAYLHEKQHSIHRDLKSGNILLARTKRSGELVAKIADFGMARILKQRKEEFEDIPSTSQLHSTNSSSSNVESQFDRQNTQAWVNMMTTEKGTAQWMAPEIVRSVYAGKERTDLTQAIDSYAMGIILWETMSLDAPWRHLKRYFEVFERVLKGERPALRKDCVENAPEGYVKIMLELQSEKVEDRPSFSVLRDWLENTLRSKYGDDEKTLSIKISSSSSSSLRVPGPPSIDSRFGNSLSGQGYGNSSDTYGSGMSDLFSSIRSRGGGNAENNTEEETTKTSEKGIELT